MRSKSFLMMMAGVLLLCLCSVVPVSAAMTLYAPGDNIYYFGENIRVFPNETPGLSPVPYMFMTGPGLPAEGAQLNGDPASSPVINLNGASFSRPIIILDTFNFTLSQYDWQTEEVFPLGVGNYTLYAETLPFDAYNVTHVNNTYAAYTIELKKPFLAAAFNRYNATIGSTFNLTGVKEGNHRAIAITCTNSSLTYGPGTLPSDGVHPDDFSVPSVTGDNTTFAMTAVQTDGTFFWYWNTGSISGGSVLPGTSYGFVVENTPVSIGDALNDTYPDNYYSKFKLDIDGVYADYAVDTASGTSPLTVAFTDVSTSIPNPIAHNMTIIDFGDGFSQSAFTGTVYHTYSGGAATFYPNITVCDSHAVCDSGTNATISMSAPVPGSIEVDSVPGGAWISIDDVEVFGMVTNDTVGGLSPGTYRVTVGKNNWYNTSKLVTVTSGVTSVVDVALDPSSGSPSSVQTAVQIILKHGLNDDTTGKSISAHPTTLPKKPIVNVWTGDLLFTDDTLGSCTLVAVDNAPEANWEHPIRYYCVDTVTGKFEKQDATSPATAYQLTFETGMRVPQVLWQPDDPYVWKQACVNDCSNNFAVLIDGGKDKDNNFVRYWNDIAFMYNNLIEYGYAPKNITVLMSDGSNSAVDRCIATTGTTCTGWDSSPRDLTGDGVYETIQDAKKNTVLNTLDSMKPGGSKALPAGANLIIFSTGHGGLEASSGNAYIYAWSPDGLNPYIRDTELMSKLNALYQLNSITLVIENCNGGGFKDNLIDLDPSPSPATQKRVIMTAANGNEWSYGNGFSNAWTTAVAGHTRYYGRTCTPLDPVCARELDKGADLLPNSIIDERISASEGFAYAVLKDPYATTDPNPVDGYEHPSIFANAAGSDTTTQFISECTAAATPKITVTSPTTGDRWQQDTIVRVSWDAPGLAGKHVKITLLKSGALSAVIKDTVPATNPSFVEWRVPAGQTIATTYTVKVETLDADTAVSSTSKTFSVIAAPTTDSGTLTITAVNEAGEVLAAAYTVSRADGTIVASGITGTTTGDISPLGKYTATLTLDHYYPFSAEVQVDAGTKTVPYTMRMLPQGANGEDLDKTPYGGVDVSSTPSGARVWFSKADAVPADTSIDTPHVIILTEPGDYKVYVTKELYQQSETRTVTVDIRTPTREPVKVDFTLTPELSSDYTIDGFYAPIEMNGVVNSAKAGQTIPVKWHLSNMNGDIADPASFVALRSYQIGCTELTGDPVKAVDEYAPGNSGLQYLGNGNWQYNWVTPKSYASTTNGPCRKMYVEFEHGQKSDEALFKFK